MADEIAHEFHFCPTCKRIWWKWYEGSPESTSYVLKCDEPDCSDKEHVHEFYSLGKGEGDERYCLHCRMSETLWKDMELQKRMAK